MSIFYDMMLHLFNSFTTIVYYTGVMKVKAKGKWFNEAGLVTALFASAIVSHVFRYYPPLRFSFVLAVMFITANAFFDASFANKVRTTAESIVMSMLGEAFGMIVYAVVRKDGFNTMNYDSPDRAVMSLVLSAFVAGIVPIAILLRKKANVRELWSVAMTQAAIMVTQISMIIIAYFSSEHPSRELVYLISIVQIPGILLSLFCTRAILATTRLTIGEKEKEFEKTKADMEYGYYRLALENNEKLSVLRHDISNTIQTAMTLIHNGDIRKGDELLRDMDRVNRSTAPVVVCDNDIINVILALKHDEMLKKGITFKVNVKTELSDFPATDRELTSVLTNLTDNAMDACSECVVTEKIVEMTFGKEQGFYIIRMENTYCRDKLYIPESVAMAVSTKENKEIHGFGLRSIYEISKKYDGNLSMYAENGRVVSVVTFADKNV